MAKERDYGPLWLRKHQDTQRRSAQKPKHSTLPGNQCRKAAASARTLIPLTAPLDCGRPYLHAASRRLRRKDPPRYRFFHAVTV